MDTTRDEAIARLAQALDVPAELLAISPQRWNCIAEHEWKERALGALDGYVHLMTALELAAVDIRYRRRVSPSESVVAYVPQWVYDKLDSAAQSRLSMSGITVRTDWADEESQPCYTVPCPSW